MKTITYNPETHVLVPRDLIADAKQIFCSDVEPNTNGNCLDVIEWFSAMIAAAPQPEPNHNWCAGCSPDNCSGCGAEPVAYIFKPNNELLWPHEVDQNVFASDPEDYDLLYTTPQPVRTAELEAALKLAKAGIEWALSNINCEPFEWSDEENADAHREAIETLAKINEVLK